MRSDRLVVLPTETHGRVLEYLLSSKRQSGN